MGLLAAAPRGPLFRLAWWLYLGLAAAGVVGLGRGRGRIGLDTFVDPASAAVDLAAAALLAATLLALWAAARRFLAAAREVEREIAALLGPLSPEEAVGLALLSGIAEEIFFRGALQHFLGWLPAALLFGALHLGPRRVFWVWTLYALVAGVMFGLWVDRRGALGGAILAHVAVNAVQLLRLRREAPPG